MKLNSRAASAASLALVTISMVSTPQAKEVKDLGVIGAEATSFGDSFDKSEKKFNDHYTFRIDDASSGSGATSDLYLNLWGIEVESIKVKLKDVATWKTDSTLSNGFHLAGLEPGLYDLKLSGRVAQAGGSYGGTIQAIASAAPEPETYLMMLLGLGGVGYATRLRRKDDRNDA
jgi:hypothetical protein